MKILDKTEKLQLTYFRDIQPGMAFKFDGGVFIRIVRTDAGSNAIGPSCGGLHAFTDEMQVISFPNAVLHLNDPA